MTVIQAIEALLYDHDAVIVPALGTFVRRNESAQVNVITNEFQKPTSSLQFDPSQREENRLIIEYLMQHDNITEEEARQRIAAFVAEGYAKMREGKSLVLEGIGTLCHNALGELIFEPDPKADFNADAFGLTDLDVQPVFGESIHQSPEPETKSNQTQLEPVQIETPPQKKVSTSKPPRPSGNDTKRGNLNWLWILLLILLIDGVALWFFLFQPLEPKPLTPGSIAVSNEDTIEEPIELPVDSSLLVIDIPESIVDTGISLIDIVEEPDPSVKVDESSSIVKVVKPQPESKAFIVGGCFSIEQNALNMVTEAKGQGCSDAFAMQRGSMYYVCYGQYTSTAEAKAALPEVLASFNPKAWILTK